ncbi:hypothetical protein JXR01_02655 [Candidatus Kaiserbacteria bacterium]|nr:MAG: hypothetical protein JXR01_02655 [Candidatus Kaiserbacteria bacterium]
MKKKQLYIGISVLIIILIVVLLAWAVFIGQQQQRLQQETEDLGYFDSALNTSSRGGGGGGLFGGTFGDVINNNTNVDGTSDESIVAKPRLRQLYNLPTAGFIKKRSNAIRFVDKATGHVFEKDLPDGTTTRLDQTTVPQVQEALFTNDGDGVLRRYIGEDGSLVTIYSDLKGTETQSSSLPTQISEITTNSSGNQISFLQQTLQGSILYLANPNGSGEEEVSASILQGWNMDWQNDVLLVSQKASSDLPGSAYVINTSTGVKTLVLQQLKGLAATLSPDGENVLYSHNGDRGIPVLTIKNTKSGKITTLDIASLAEKCVWHPNGISVFCALPNAFPKGEYPDVWYQGRVHFSDSLFEVRTDTKRITHIVSPQAEHGVSLDIINLSVSTNGNVVFFINKTDQTLWSVTLPKTTEEIVEEEGGDEEGI